MLTLPRFEVLLPQSVDEAVAALQSPEARIFAGGTDLLPNLKHRIERVGALVSLQRIAELRGIEQTDDTVRIGAMCTLTELATSETIGRHFPSLAMAAGLVASPQIRNVGTLGGNINLDTRCRYVNQTVFWREALGGCLKAETCERSKVCHVVPGGQRCVAALSSDSVPVLVSLDARLVLQGPAGTRALLVAEYFNTDGVRHTVREPHEILTFVEIPKPRGLRRSAYVKWRPRKSIDYPLVSIALRFDEAPDREAIAHAVAVLGVLGATPRVVRLTAFHGRDFADAALPAEIADVVFGRAKTLPNVPYDPEYRRRLVRVLTRRAMESLA